MKEKIIQMEKQRPCRLLLCFFHASFGLCCDPNNEEADKCRPGHCLQKDLFLLGKPYSQKHDAYQEDDRDKPPRQPIAQKSEIRVPKKPCEERTHEDTSYCKPKECQSHNNPPFVQKYLLGMFILFLYYNYTFF